MNEKTCLILGSDSDVGQACARRFAREGFNILLAARKVSDYQNKLASDLSVRYSVVVSMINFDALRTEEHLKFYESITIKPDVVVSVFGYLGNHERAEIDFSEAYKIITTNFTGNVSILGIIAHDMADRKNGTIICISSVAGERGRKSNYIYGSAKAGLTAFLSGLRARMYLHHVHVATIIPGYIRTKMIQHMVTPKYLTASPGQVANSAWRAYQKKRNVIYVLLVWRCIMFIVRNIPENSFKKLNL